MENQLFGKKGETYIFANFSKVRPKGRRLLCYDQKALEDRKKKPEDSAKM